MLGTLDETIAAIASAGGGAARGIVRISGAGTLDCLRKCFRPEGSGSIDGVAVPSVICGALIARLAGNDAALLPCDLHLWPTAKSYTRQPAAELHTIGSAPLLGAALDSVCRAGARFAEPGEFTLRAFLAGRLDLVQAEAVLGVVDARDASQRRTALQQLAGGLSRPLGAIRDDLVSLLAELEAGLDFSEEDIEFIAPEELSRRFTVASGKINDVADQLQARGEVGANYRAVLIGPPNAGKSSLFNALVTRFAEPDAKGHPAIVSAQPGTTRDYLVRELDIEGIVCELVDTAGTEQHGRPRAIDLAVCDQTAEQHLEADLLLDCVSADQVTANDDTPRCITDRLRIVTKADIAPKAAVTPNPSSDGREGGLEMDPDEWIRTSAITGEGVSQLAKAIRAEALAAIVSHGDAVATTAIRCRESLRRAADSIDRAHRLAESRLGDELIAAEIHVALHDLGVVVGVVYTDDILDQVFSNFCIGK